MKTAAERFARRLTRFSEIEALSLSPYQIYPPRELLSPEHLLPERHPLLDRSTPVASMGSCFAREIKDHLQTRGFNYITYGEGPTLRHGSAPWERVYNTACVRQEIERAFGLFEPDLITLKDGSTLDPHRKNLRLGADAERICEEHATAARLALSTAEVFVLTLGLSEIWFDSISGKVFAGALPNEVFDKSRHAQKLLSPEENIHNLSDALELIHSENPTLRVVITVSPIPLRATFFSRSAIISNTVSKASLLWAAHIIADKYDWVHYFPSYEIVTTLLDEPFDWDFRHVTREAVGTIMQSFESTFVVGDS